MIRQLYKAGFKILQQYEYIPRGNWLRSTPLCSHFARKWASGNFCWIISCIQPSILWAMASNTSFTTRPPVGSAPFRKRSVGGMNCLPGSGTEEPQKTVIRRILRHPQLNSVSQSEWFNNPATLKLGEQTTYNYENYSISTVCMRVYILIYIYIYIYICV